jgi:hypothetical protein
MYPKRKMFEEPLRITAVIVLVDDIMDRVRALRSQKSHTFYRGSCASWRKRQVTASHPETVRI